MDKTYYTNGIGIGKVIISFINITQIDNISPIIFHQFLTEFSQIYFIFKSKIFLFILGFNFVTNTF